MAKKEPKGISLLWKTEDWLAVWVGFFVIVFILAGLTVKTPKFKWTTGKEFSTFIAQTTPAVDGLVKAAAEKKEKALRADAAALKAAIGSMDRKTIGDAAKKMEETSKGVKDEGLKKKSGKVAKDIKGARAICFRGCGSRSTLSRTLALLSNGRRGSCAYTRLALPMRCSSPPHWHGQRIGRTARSSTRLTIGWARLRIKRDSRSFRDGEGLELSKVASFESE